MTTDEMDAFLAQIDLNDGAGAELASARLVRTGTMRVLLYERALVHAYGPLDEDPRHVREQATEKPLGPTTGDPWVHYANALDLLRRQGWKVAEQ
jgi:hypothetical protein